MKLTKKQLATKHIMEVTLHPWKLTPKDVINVKKWNELLFTSPENAYRMMAFAQLHYRKALNLTKREARALAMVYYENYGLSVLEKPIVIAIVGNSGSGKSMIADYLFENYWIPTLQSYTTRKPRYKGENSHKFISAKEFNSIPKNNRLAYTKWGEYEYCCTTDDIKETSLVTYVIDQNGLNMLQQRDDITLLSIFIESEKDERIKRVGKDRVDRDNGLYDLKLEYDYIVKNNYDDSIFGEFDYLIETISNTYNLNIY